MIQDMPAPPEAEAIKLARKAARLTPAEASARVRAAGGKISDTYWRDIERGHGGRRGVRVPARASDGLLAQMAEAVGVTPDQLRDAAQDHPDGEDRARAVRKAARVLEEIQRRHYPDPAGSEDDGAKVIRFPAPARDLINDLANARLADVERELGSPVNLNDGIEVAMAAQSKKEPAVIAREIRAIRAIHDQQSGSRGATGGRLAALPAVRLE